MLTITRHQHITLAVQASIMKPRVTDMLDNYRKAFVWSSHQAQSFIFVKPTLQCVCALVRNHYTSSTGQLST